MPQKITTHLIAFAIYLQRLLLTLRIRLCFFILIKLSRNGQNLSEIMGELILNLTIFNISDESISLIKNIEQSILKTHIPFSKEHGNNFLKKIYNAIPIISSKLLPPVYFSFLNCTQDTPKIIPTTQQTQKTSFTHLSQKPTTSTKEFVEENALHKAVIEAAMDAAMHNQDVTTISSKITSQEEPPKNSKASNQGVVVEDVFSSCSQSEASDVHKVNTQMQMDTEENSSESLDDLSSSYCSSLSSSYTESESDILPSPKLTIQPTRKTYYPRAKANNSQANYNRSVVISTTSAPSIKVSSLQAKSPSCSRTNNSSEEVEYPQQDDKASLTKAYGIRPPLFTLQRRSFSTRPSPSNFVSDPHSENVLEKNKLDVHNACLTLALPSTINFRTGYAKSGWTPGKVACLVHGVNSFGVGKWKNILEDSPSLAERYSSVDIKDKWRNLIKSTYVIKASNKNSFILNENYQPNRRSQPLDPDLSMAAASVANRSEHANDGDRRIVTFQSPAASPMKMNTVSHPSSTRRVASPASNRRIDHVASPFAVRGIQRSSSGRADQYSTVSPVIESPPSHAASIHASPPPSSTRQRLIESELISRKSTITLHNPQDDKDKEELNNSGFISRRRAIAMEESKNIYLELKRIRQPDSHDNQKKKRRKILSKK